MLVGLLIGHCTPEADVLDMEHLKQVWAGIARKKKKTAEPILKPFQGEILTLWGRKAHAWRIRQYLPTFDLIKTVKLNDKLRIIMQTS